MRPEIQNLGWYVRRSAEPKRLTDFYEHVVGLPVLRRYGQGTMFWAGETMSFEVTAGGQPAPAYRDQTEAASVPMFRVLSMDRVVARLKEHGVRFLVEPFERPHSVFAYFLDTDGHPVGLAERRRSSDRAHDVEAARRWDSGHVAVAGLPAMPDHFQLLQWVILRCHDTKKVSAFFRDVVGLDELYTSGQAVVFSLGDIMVLELAPGNPGGLPASAAADRSEYTDVFMMRVDDCQAVAADLKAKGATIINEPFDVVEGTICYFTTPEGHLVGIQKRWPTSPRAEDIEAAQRRLKQKSRG